MTTNAIPVVDAPWTSGVEITAAEEGVGPFLLPLLEMTRQIFPNAERLDVVMETDPEIDDDWRLVFRVDVALPPPEAAQALQEWYRQLFAICSAPNVNLFRLGLQVLSR